MKFFILILMVLAACQSLPKYNRKYREYKVSGPQEADEIFATKLNFLRLTYEQIQSPTMKVTKFGHECLQKIKISEPVQTPKGRMSVSHLFFGADYGIGLCPMNPGAREGRFILIYCKNKETVYQISCYLEDCKSIQWENEC